jgi:hypothetical protein
MDFAEHFRLNKSQAELDFVDVPIDGDIPLFVDPFAISRVLSDGRKNATLL